MAIAISMSFRAIASAKKDVEEAMWSLQISQGNVENTDSKSQVCVRILGSVRCIACRYAIEKNFHCKQFSSNGKWRDFLV